MVQCKLHLSQVPRLTLRQTLTAANPVLACTQMRHIRNTWFYVFLVILITAYTFSRLQHWLIPLGLLTDYSKDYRTSRQGRAGLIQCIWVSLELMPMACMYTQRVLKNFPGAEKGGVHPYTPPTPVGPRLWPRTFEGWRIGNRCGQSWHSLHSTTRLML